MHEGINNISTHKVNPQIVEQLESAHKSVEYVEPTFNHHEQLNEFVQTLEFEEDEKREATVVSWVTPIINRVLNVWRDKYSSNSELIKNARNEKQRLEQAREQNQRQLGEIEKQQEQLSLELSGLENKQHEKDMQGLDGIVDWKAETLKLRLFLAGSILLAFATFFIYLQLTATASWGKMDLTTKSQKVLQAYKAGHDELIDYFIEAEDAREKLEAMTLSVNDIDQAMVASLDKLTLSQYISVEGFLSIVVAFTAIVLVLAGKVISGVYERLKFPDWFYYGTALSFFFVVAPLLYSMSEVGRINNELRPFPDKIAEIRFQIIEIEEESFFGSGFEDDEEEDPQLVAKKAELQQILDEQTRIGNDLAFYDTLFKILSFLAEMTISAFAWMTYADYSRKRMEQSGGASGQRKLLDNLVEKNKTKMVDLETEQSNLLEENVTISSLIARLEALLGSLMSVKMIESVSQDFYQQEIQFAKQILMKYAHKWENEKRSI